MTGLNHVMLDSRMPLCASVCLCLATVQQESGVNRPFAHMLGIRACQRQMGARPGAAPGMQPPSGRQHTAMLCAGEGCRGARSSH